jgi:AcrR family transcriptional regulator
MSSHPASESGAREAWAGDSPLRHAATERLLDAAARCIERDGLSVTSIASVATEAGVSRPTVYRYFDDRHALLMATLLREGRDLASRTAAHLRDVESAADMVVEAVLFVLNQVPHEPLWAEVWTSTLLDASMLDEFTQPQAIAIAREALDRLERLADWKEADALEGIEIALRFALTLLIAPGPDRSDAEMREMLHRRLVPALGL